MKKIILLLLILNFSSLFSQSNDSNLKLNDTWFGGESKNNGKQVILRGRQHLKNFIDSKLYNDQIEIVWSLERKTENGIPTLDENFFMGKVEDALLNNLEADLQSILTIAHTNNNVRSWIFYTKSVPEFLKRLNDVLSNFDKIPIQISNEKDEGWELYSEILKGYNLEPK